MPASATVIPKSISAALNPDSALRPSEVILIPLKDDGSPDLQTFGAPLRMQYFPDEITDTKAVSYQQKDIPGGSLPIYQWVSSGVRQLQFTVRFSTDVDAIADATARTQVFSNTGGLRDRNVDIRSAVSWLRSFLLPRYVDGSGGSGGGGAASIGGSAPGGIGGSSGTAGITFQTRPPRRLRLYIPNSGIGGAGGLQSARDQQALLDSITCVMTQCEVTWNAFFPSGYPRLATVQLGFDQIAQIGSRVVFPTADGMQRLVNPDNIRTFYGYALHHRGKGIEEPDGGPQRTRQGEVADSLAAGIFKGVGSVGG